MQSRTLRTWFPFYWQLIYTSATQLEKIESLRIDTFTSGLELVDRILYSYTGVNPVMTTEFTLVGISEKSSKNILKFSPHFSYITSALIFSVKQSSSIYTVKRILIVEGYLI